MSNIFKILLLLILITDFFYPQNNPNLKSLFYYDGLEVDFLFYPNGNGLSENGIVILLRNNNNYTIKYEFNLKFKGSKFDSDQIIKGNLKANEIITGSSNGLYFLPFSDSTNILYEIEVNKIKIIKE